MKREDIPLRLAPGDSWYESGEKTAGVVWTVQTCRGIHRTGLHYILNYVSFQVVNRRKQVEIQTCLFTLHTFDCLVLKHNCDVQQAVDKKVRHYIDLMQTSFLSVYNK